MSGAPATDEAGARRSGVVAIVRTALVLGALALSSCECLQRGPCTSDRDCDPLGEGYNVCDVATGACLCNDDRGCGEGDICNAVGRCQAVSGCLSNDDCGSEGLFCDITTSRCLSATACSGEHCCSLDSQCPFGQICDVVTTTCVEGCRDAGDCILGEGCVGSGLGRLGTCALSCTEDNQCPPQHLCNLGDGACELDTRGPYCFGCSGGVSSDDCGDFANYCLVDTVNGGSFCGVDCAAGQACPSGYACSDVIIVLSTTQCVFPERCQGEAGSKTCSVAGTPCEADVDCPNGFPFGNCRQLLGRSGSCEVGARDCETDADCSSGRCVLVECRGDEADTFGFCSCTRDSDCSRFADRCVGADASDPGDQIPGVCQLSGRECFEDLDCDVVACVNGGCFLGRNCAPSNDRDCSRVQPP